MTRERSPGKGPVRDAIRASADQLVDEGRQTFRFDTFGDEAFWGNTIKLHQAIAGSAHGGVGSGVSPHTALSVGLRVDSDALPSAVQAQIKNGTANLDDFFGLGPTASQKSDLIEYLKSL